MKKIVLKLDLHDNREKQKALKSVATFPGIDSIGMDMKEKKLTVIGAVDPVTIVSKLRKNWPTTNIISVGPAKEPEKKEEPKKNGDPQQQKKEEEDKKDCAAGEAKKDGKDEPKKEEGGGGKKEEEAKKDGGGGGEKKDGGGGGEKKDGQPAAVPQPRPQFLPQPLYPYVQPQPMYPYPQQHPDPRIMELVKAYRSYNPQQTTHYYVQSMEENPNACVIC